MIKAHVSPRLSALLFVLAALLPLPLFAQTAVRLRQREHHDQHDVADGQLLSTSLSVSAGATLTIGGGSTYTTTGGITVSGTSAIVLQSINNSAQVNGTWQGTGVTLNAATISVDGTSSINADAQGYLPQAGPGAANPGNP